MERSGGMDSENSESAAIFFPPILYLFTEETMRSVTTIGKKQELRKNEGA